MSSDKRTISNPSYIQCSNAPIVGCSLGLDRYYTNGAPKLINSPAIEVNHGRHKRQ